MHTKNISTWHSKLNAIPSILKNNFYFISNDSKLSNIFKQKLTSTYQKNNITFWLPSEKKTLQPHSNVWPCGKCKLCPRINTAKLITNDKLNITEKAKGTRNCKEREGNYAAQCFKHKALYIWHIGQQFSGRLSKNRYDIKNRQDNGRLAKYFHQSHNVNDNLNVTILHNDIKAAAAQTYHEGKWIYRLKL